MKPTLKNGKSFLVPQNIDLNQAGIYKIFFDDYFYIGSTSNFTKRIQGFRSLGGKKGSAFNKKMYECARDCSVILFEIIQVVDDISLLRGLETEYIQSFIGNPLLLNRAFDGNSNKGIRWTDEEKSKISQTNKGNGRPKNTPAGKIEKYSIDGAYISSYTSCMAAGLDSGMSHRMVMKILHGEKGNYNGVTFLRIEAPPKPKKIPTYGRGRKLSKEKLEAFLKKREARITSPDYIPPKLPAHAKPVIQYDISGNQVNIFPSISYAARSIGTTPNTFQKTISKSKTGYHKGYIWEYAEKVVA